MHRTICTSVGVGARRFYDQKRPEDSRWKSLVSMCHEGMKITCTYVANACPMLLVRRYFRLWRRKQGDKYD